jgi:hypothetical protein
MRTAFAVLALITACCCGGGAIEDGCWIHVSSHSAAGAFCEVYRECEPDWLIPAEDDGDPSTEPEPDQCNMSQFFADQGLPANNPLRECEPTCPEQAEACGQACTDALGL